MTTDQKETAQLYLYILKEAMKLDGFDFQNCGG